MRQIPGYLTCFAFGAFTMTAAATTVCDKWFTPSVESYPEFRQIRLERDRLKEKVSDLEFHILRRGSRDPINPNGRVIPAEDRIPAPKEPLPIPERSIWPIPPVKPE